MFRKFSWLSCFVLMLMSFKWIDNIITRLGLHEQYTKTCIMNNLIGRYTSGPLSATDVPDPSNVYDQSRGFKIPRASMLQNIITGDKAGAAKELCEYTREYVESASFANEYARLREESIPLTEGGASIGSLRKSIQVYQTNINNYKTDTKYVAEQEQLKAEAQRKLDILLEQSKKPYEGKDRWMKMYPADPAELIKKRLQEYLALVPTVDFNAKTTGTGRRQTFVNPVYEKKGVKWKAVFRAGKEVNDVVVTFVKEWLKQGIVTGKPDRIPEPAATNQPPATNNTGNGNSNNTNNTKPVTTPVPSANNPDPAPEQKPEEKKEEPKQKKSIFNKVKSRVGIPG